MPTLVEVGVKFALQKADEVDDGVEPWRLARRRQPDIRYPDDRRFDPAWPGRRSAHVGDDGAGTSEQGHGNEVYGAALGLSRGLDPTRPKLAEGFERQRRRLVPVALDQPHIRLGPVLGLRLRPAGHTVPAPRLTCGCILTSRSVRLGSRRDPDALLLDPAAHLLGQLGASVVRAHGPPPA